MPTCGAFSPLGHEEAAMALLTLPDRRDTDTTGWVDIGHEYNGFLELLVNYEIHSRSDEGMKREMLEGSLLGIAEIAREHPEFISGGADVGDTRFRPLSFCALNGLLHSSEWLLEHGANPMQQGKHQDLLPIHDAAMGGASIADVAGTPAVIELLVGKLGPSVLMEMCFAGTALHVAALAGNTGACLTIVEIEPAAFDELDWAGKTALESALRRKADQRHEGTIAALRSWDARRMANQALQDAGLPSPSGL